MYVQYIAHCNSFQIVAGDPMDKSIVIHPREHQTSPSSGQGSHDQNQEEKGQLVVFTWYAHKCDDPYHMVVAGVTLG